MTGRARLALALMALLALIAVVYAPVTRGALIGDDHSLVGTNPQVQRGSFMEIFRQPFWAPDPVRDARAAYYRPLAVLSLRTDFAFAGDSAASFHTTNLVLHLIATMVLALVARRFGASTTVALIAAGVWALHPRTTESVAWISGRADVLASLLAIAAIGLWPWYADATMKGGLGVRLRAAAAGLAVLLGLLAKEVAFAAAVAIAAGTWLGAPGTLRERARLVAPRLAYVLVPVLGYGVLRWMAMRSVTWTVTPLGSEARGATILEAIGRYAEMTFDPWHPTTSIGISGDLDRTRAAVGGVVLVACTALVVRALVKRRPAPHRAGAPLAPSVAMVVATALGGSSLALVVHILPIVLASGIAADRLLYLPLASLALGLAVASAKLSPRGRKIAAAVAVALGATFVPVTRARARHYTDELLFRVVAAEQSHPHSTSAKSGLGHVLREDTELDLACRLHASVRRTLEQIGGPANARYLHALENLGGCYAVLGDYDRAAAAYAQVLSLKPDSARIHMEIGLLQLHTFALDEAESSLRRALALDGTLDRARRAIAMMPQTRADLVVLATEDARRADRARWARLLLRVGRVPDATKAWLEIVVDPTASPDDGAMGMDYLLRNADVITARQATDAYVARRDPAWQLMKVGLARRLSRQAKIDALRPRLEALAAQ